MLKIHINGSYRNVFKCRIHDGHFINDETDVTEMTCAECGLEMYIVKRVKLPAPLTKVSIADLLEP